MVLCSAVACLAAWLLFSNPSSAFDALPNPNGYEALVAASAKLARLPDFGESNRAETVMAFMSENQQALTELKRALDLPSAVTVEPTESWVTGHSRELISLKAVATSLDAQADVLARQEDNLAALAVTLDGLRFSQAIQKGGVFIDYMVGSACELIAVRRLTNLLMGLDLEACKRVQHQLEILDRQRDPISKLAEREARWSWHAFDLVKRIRMMIQTRSLHPGKEWQKILPDTGVEYRKRTTETRLAILRFASRRFELEHGKAAARAADLVPDYLPQQLTNLITDASLEFP